MQCCVRGAKCTFYKRILHGERPKGLRSRTVLKGSNQVSIDRVYFLM